MPERQGEPPSATHPPSTVAKPMVSLVVPAYNEAAIISENLATLCRYMEGLAADYDWEMIVVNDGSSDETGDLADKFAADRPNISILHHMFNFRLGQALRYAFENCRGDYVITLDMDLSYAPEHISRMLTEIRRTRAKIVVASPYMKGGRVSNVPWLRKMFSVVANRFLALTVTRTHIAESLTTLTGMVRAYDRRFLQRLNLKAMDVDINSEILYKAMILRARMVEVPAHLDWGTAGGAPGRGSSIRFIKSILSALLSGFIFRPFMFFVLPGLLLMLLSFYPLAWVAVHTVTHLKATASAQTFGYRLSEAIGAAFLQAPHAFIVGGIALMVAIQLMSLGILSLQNKKYFEETFHLGESVLHQTRMGKKTLRG